MESVNYRSMNKRKKTVTQHTPQLSVVIPARNAAGTIVPVLEALLASQGVTIELLVVDDASTDDTAELVARYPVTLIRQKVCRGPAAARNRGAQEITSNLLVFVDADVLVRPDTLEKIHHYLEENPGVSAIFGSYDDAPPITSFISRYRNLMHHFVHQGGRTEAGTFWCGCGAVRSEVFRRMGGLTEAFNRPSIEDIEFGARLDRAGHRIRLVKNIQVTHLKQWTLWQIIRTDVRDRAIPWTLLLLAGSCRSTDLNLQFRHRLSAMAAILGLASLIPALTLHPLFLLVTAICGLVFHLVNRDLFLFFTRTAGWVFAVRALPLLLLFYLYASVGYVAGLMLHLSGKRLE